MQVSVEDADAVTVSAEPDMYSPINALFGQVSCPYHNCRPPPRIDRRLNKRFSYCTPSELIYIYSVLAGRAAYFVPGCPPVYYTVLQYTAPTPYVLRNNIINMPPWRRRLDPYCTVTGTPAEGGGFVSGRSRARHGRRRFFTPLLTVPF